MITYIIIINHSMTYMLSYPFPHFYEFYCYLQTYHFLVVYFDF